MTTAQVNRAGIARTFQNIRLFRNLTVLDNVLIGLNNEMKYSAASAILRLPGYWRRERIAKERALELLSIFNMENVADHLAGSLPYGAQRRLEIVRALATNPCLLLLDEPAAGMNPTETAELMDTISFVFQNSRLLKGSILDNVRLGRPQATEAEVLAALKAAQCMDIVEKFPAGIHTVIDTKGVYLSGGEQQRIAIARAMLKNAPVVILDEATAYIDPENEALVQKAISTLTVGKTLIVIAHRLSTIVGADNIVVVKDGTIHAQGTHEKLLETCPLYRDMWQAHIGAKDQM